MNISTLKNSRILMGMDILIIEIMGMAFPQLFMLRNDISTAQGKKLWTEVRSHHFFPFKII